MASALILCRFHHIAHGVGTPQDALTYYPDEIEKGIKHCPVLGDAYIAVNGYKWSKAVF